MGSGTAVGPQPWCGMFVEWCWQQAGINAMGATSPSTFAMCAVAQQESLFLSPNHPVPAGAALVDCGVHTELAIADAGPLDGGAHRAVRAIGGNVGDGVRLTWRSTADFRVIVVPDVTAGQAEPMHVFGFDDPLLAPKKYGPWHDIAARDKVIHAHFAHEVQLHLVQKLRSHDPNPYSFRVYTGTKWQFGPWDDKDTRDREMAAYSGSHGHRTMRTWNRVIQPQTVDPAALTKGVKTT